uniref:Bacteriophage P22 tailspike N-terminal domain-containing protein n=1 Tax=Glossina brevipalpis TaxID=37001 RepID=A0A1A9VZ06_9MUSC
MADITPNIVVSMPSQIFTQRREFKSCSNGKIYIGKIDTDPTIAENQIPVYLENEDGKYTRVGQPLIIGTGGYPVYNGQIAKFVTEEGHAMAVYDGDGVQQFYFPNVLKYEPKKAIKELYDALDTKFDKTGGTVNGPMTVEGNAKFTGTDYLDKSGVITDKKNNVRETNGLRIRGIEGQRADLRYWEKIGQGASLKLNVISGKSNGEFDFRQNGEFRASGGATFGGNVTISWGGRTATFHENGDVAGPIWGGALSGYINRTFVTKARLTGFAWTGGLGYEPHTFGNGGVIVGIQAGAYTTNSQVAVRYLQLWVGGTWRYKPDENSAVFKKFGPYTNLFLKDESGNDWYEVQKLFATDTLKIAYIEENGLVKMVGRDADMLVPIDLSVTEGEWAYRDGKIQPRIYTHAELEQKATWEKDNLLDKAARVIAPLQDAVDLDMATGGEKAALLAWKKYRVLLNRVDITQAPDIDWPEPPDSGGQ